VRRRDARAAVGRRGRAGLDAERGILRTQFVGREEAPVGVEVRRGGRGARAGHVAGARVDGLDLAPISLRRARIEHDAGRRQDGHAVGVDDRHRAEVRGGVAAFGGGRALLERMPRRGPGPEPTVEHPHVAEPGVAQQPPRSRRGLVPEVVHDHRGVAVAQAPRAHGLGERRLRRQRVPPTAGHRVVGEVVVEVDVDGAGDMPCQECRSSVGHGERPAHVEHDRAGVRPCGPLVVEATGEVVGGDEDRHGRRGHQGSLRFRFWISGTWSSGTARSMKASKSGTVNAE
jgi:hypothetical protein